MREISTELIRDTVARLCMEANYFISSDIQKAFEQGLVSESADMPKEVLRQLLQNAQIASKQEVPICQDTGMAVVFVELGQEACISGGLLEKAIEEGVRKGYEEGYLRKSVVKDPIRRENTKDNTPAIVHYKLVAGDRLKITVAPKGFGSENMSALYMLTPSEGIEGVKRVVLETVQKAGPNPCPPIIVGVGVGGNMEKAALLAKEALLRPVDKANNDEYWNEIEKELLKRINKLGIGPAGLGGNTTALAVHINPFATHIAGLPVAVNIGCHVTRHAEAVL